MTNSDQDFTGNNAGLNNGGLTTTGYGAETAGTPGGLAAASYTGGNGHSGQVVTTGSRAVNNGATTNAAGSNSTLPQTGNDDAAQAVALGGLSALATLSLLGATKKRHE